MLIGTALCLKVLLLFAAHGHLLSLRSQAAQLMIWKRARRKNATRDELSTRVAAQQQAKVSRTKPIAHSQHSMVCGRMCPECIEQIINIPRLCPSGWGRPLVSGLALPSWGLGLAVSSLGVGPSGRGWPFLLGFGVGQHSVRIIIITNKIYFFCKHDGGGQEDWGWLGVGPSSLRSELASFVWLKL